MKLLELQNPHLSQPQSPKVFIARSYGDLSSQNWNHGLGGLVEVCELSLLIFNCHTWVGTSPFCISNPPTSLNMASSVYPYLNFCLARILEVPNDGCSVVVFFFFSLWLWENVSTVFTYTAILTGSLFYFILLILYLVGVHFPQLNYKLHRLWYKSLAFTVPSTELGSEWVLYNYLLNECIKLMS